MFEPQPWKSYKKKCKLTSTTIANYKQIQFKPTQFVTYLCEHGFELVTSHTVEKTHEAKDTELREQHRLRVAHMSSQATFQAKQGDDHASQLGLAGGRMIFQSASSSRSEVAKTKHGLAHMSKPKNGFTQRPIHVLRKL